MAKSSISRSRRGGAPSSGPGRKPQQPGKSALAAKAASRSQAARKRVRRKGKPNHAFTDDSRGPRLQKVLAEAGVASRRDCEHLIENGEVTVNGHVVSQLPAWVDPHKDHIAVSGRRIRQSTQHVYVMLFKPRGVVSTNEDPEGRKRAIDLVHYPNARLYPVGRLDIESSGLLLLTNDGELANRLTHPRHGVHKVYEVTVDGALDEKDVKRLENGLFLHDQKRSERAKRTAQSTLKLIKKDRDRTRLRMELGEGRNRQIRRMMAQLGHKVRKLRRVQMGPVKLKGLQPGQWRELLPAELTALRKAAGAQ